jgi:hypothetical protein
MKGLFHRTDSGSHKIQTLAVIGVFAIAWFAGWIGSWLWSAIAG